MQVVATKPMARWQIWLGKWLGIVSLNAALLAIVGRVRLRPAAMARDPVAGGGTENFARAGAGGARRRRKPPDHNAEIDAETEQILQERLKANPELSGADLAEVRQTNPRAGQGGLSTGAAGLYARMAD